MRDAPRLHVEAELAEGAAVPLDEERRHYLVNVMRASVGDPVRLFNAGSGEWDGRLGTAGKREALVVVERRRRAPQAGRGPVLLFAPLKRDATDLVVRMATELGVSAIRPVLTERTVAGRVNAVRLRSIAREAAEQCERLDIPAVDEPVGLGALLDDWPEGAGVAVAVERSRERRLGRGPGADALLVGPEGGFAPAELDGLRRRAFVQPISLGPLVLRAETAAAAGLALLQAERVGGDVEPG